MRDERAYFYDTIADEFASVTNPYDASRRLEIMFDELLAGVELSGTSMLDVGCGIGWFSERAAARGARMTSLDIGVRLLAHTRRRVSTRPVAADACKLPFADASFDMVISSECIEHTIDPRLALSEIIRVTRPGGLMVVTTPNQLWHFAVTIGSALKIRPYEGYEHWLRWGEMRRAFTDAGARVEQMRGFHLLPPIVPALQPLLRRMDDYGDRLGRLMVNIAVLARKQTPAVAAYP